MVTGTGTREGNINLGHGLHFTSLHFAQKKISVGIYGAAYVPFSSDRM